MNSHKNDIRIGDNEWIEFIELTSRYDQAYEIDALIASLSDLWKSLETLCLAECCGLDAFDFRPQAIRNATEGMESVFLETTLKNVIFDIEKLPAGVLVSKRLNNYIAKQTFIQLLNHIEANIGKNPVA